MQKLFTAVLVAVMALAGGALAQTFTLTDTLSNPNPDLDQFGGSDGFGGAVAVVGNNILVGASGEDTGALNAGAAYLFDGNSGALLFPIYNPTPAANEVFGTSVAAVGTNLLIGAPGANSGAGAVYLFDGDTGALIDSIANPNPNFTNTGSFGQAVAAVGNNMVVGAPFNEAGGTDAGVVYVFMPGDTLMILNPSAASGDEFGSSVAVIGNNILIGAPGDDNAKGSNAGAVHLCDGSTGAFLHTFLSPSTTTPENDRFGFSIAASANYILIGATSKESGSFISSGAAYLFNASTPYASVREYPNPSPSSFDQFSFSVAAFASNDLVAIGAPGEAPSGAGQAYLYDANVSSTVPLQALNQNPNAAAFFGHAVAAAGSYIVVGAPGENADAGAVYLFTSGQPNQPPVANAGTDQTVECASPSGTSVTLDGSGSSDPDNDPLTYTWRENGGIIAGPTTNATSPVTLAFGSHTIELTVDDGNGGTDTDEVLITVVDTTPPTITVQAPISLWPANHKYVTITVAQSVASVSDACAGSIPVSQVTIVSVSSDEFDDEPDIIIAGNCQSVDLLADRDGGGNGRVYTVNLTVADPGGNAATASHQVWIPPKNNVPAVDDGANHTVACTGGAAAALAANNGNQEVVSLERKATAAAYRPERYALLQNHPNPFNPETEIRFELPEASHVVVKIYSMLGENIRTLADGEFAAGAHTVRWNAQNDRGEKAPSGLYFYQLVTPGFTQTRRMILAK